MKTKILFMLMPVMSMALTSCGQVMDFRKEENLDKYVLSMDYHENFNVLQLTDIHWNYNSSTSRSKQYLDKVFAEADAHLHSRGQKIDLVELTGDQFMLSNTYHVKTFIKFMEEEAEKYDFTYTAIWGNHDRHGLYNPNWLADQFKNAKHCLYVEPNDNLYGRSNFVINLELAGVSMWQLFNLDSGASFSETAVSPFKDYDYIRKDQTEWFKLEHKHLGELAPSLAYYHIPQDENLKAWNAIHEDNVPLKNKFFKLEEFADNGMEEYASDFIDEAAKLGLKGAFMGHAHNVDWTVEYIVDNLYPVVIGLGVKTGTELYFAHIEQDSEDPLMKEGLKTIESSGITENFDLIGASLVTLKTGGLFDLEHLYLNERASGDFTAWVEW